LESVRRTVLAPNVVFCNALGCHTAGKCPLLSADRYGRFWPGRSKAEFKLAAANQSSKAGQQGKF